MVFNSHLISWMHKQNFVPLPTLPFQCNHRYLRSRKKVSIPVRAKGRVSSEEDDRVHSR